MIDHNAQKILLNIILRHLPDCQVFLFGSRARNTNDSGADYDIALNNNNQKISLSILTDINNDIKESAMYVSVDIIDINNVSNDFLKIAKKDFVECSQT
jgi:predicted nucleotidyltransferase